jgi:hypothetical protein
MRWHPRDLSTYLELEEAAASASRMAAARDALARQMGTR